MAKEERHSGETGLFAGDRHDLLIAADEEVRAALDEVLQTCWYSDDLVVADMVMPGNQSVYEEWLQQHIGQDFDVLCLTADLLMTPEEIFDEIKGAYEAWEGMELEASAEGVLEALNQESPVERDKPRELLIQIDQAHELGEGVLEGLFKLVAAQEAMVTPHIVLWGEMSQTASLDAVFTEPDASVRHVEIPAFSHDAIKRYLEACWAQLGTDEALPLGEQQIDKLIADSHGRAAEVDRLARALLGSSAPGWRGFLPLRHGIAALAMLVVLAVLFLFWRGGNDETQQVTRMVTADAAGSEEEAGENEPEPESEPGAETESSVPGAEPLLAGTEESPQSRPGPAPEPESEPELQRDGGGSEDSGSPVADESDVAAEGTSDTKDLSNPESERETAAVNEAPAPPDPPMDEGDARMDFLVLQATEEAFFLQLLGVSKEDSAARFVAGQAELEDSRVTLGYIESRYQGTPWFVVLLGPYADRAAAERARATLPAALREHAPWLRRAEDLQTAMSDAADPG